MSRMRRKMRIPFSLRRYVTFFLLMSFVITCCMLVFLKSMEYVTGIELSREQIRDAALLTFGNVLFLTLFCTVIDGVRRKYMVDRPVKHIVQAAERMMEGDFQVRIEPIPTLDSDDGFHDIIDCFNRMAKELAGVETLRTDFVSNVSHELKTPLTVIQNYGTLLQSPGLPEEKRIEYAKAITQASRRLANLITNILKLNKLENQQIFPEAEVYDLGEQLCQCLLTFEEQWEQKKIEISTELQDGVLVRSDPELLALVWNNLFSNALKFTEPGGSVSLTLKTKGEFAVVRVSDTGCGISSETGKHIFEKFYQGDTSHATQGNGLGLALVKRVVDIVGGDISVQSEVGKGSAFSVRIRRTEDESLQNQL